MISLTISEDSLMALMLSSAALTAALLWLVTVSVEAGICVPICADSVLR